jgi:magnesium-transporting ATPase (P-type)
MVTGDHPITAHSIAKSLNLVTGPTQKELNELVIYGLIIVGRYYHYSLSYCSRRTLDDIF